MIYGDTKLQLWLITPTPPPAPEPPVLVHVIDIKLCEDQHFDLRSPGHGRVLWLVLLRGHH
jgi:hypothetical protein